MSKSYIGKFLFGILCFCTVNKHISFIIKSFNETKRKDAYENRQHGSF